jgi:hypothetical protein
LAGAVDFNACRVDDTGRDSSLRLSETVLTALRGLTSGCLLLSVAATAGAQVEVRGTVTDSGGRPLPFVTVVSRTGNGFLSTRTHIDGSFAFPGRPHQAGHVVDASAAGYRPARHQIGPADSVITLRLTPDPEQPVIGWRIGLPAAAMAELLDAADRPLAPGELLEAGTVYRVRIRTTGRVGCVRRGEARVEVRGSTVLVAVAQYYRSARCGASEMQEYVVELPDQPRGAVEVTLVGRYANVRVRAAVP